MNNYLKIDIEGVIHIDFKPGILFIRRTFSGLKSIGEINDVNNIFCKEFLDLIEKKGFVLRRGVISSKDVYFILIDYNDKIVYSTDDICVLTSDELLKNNNYCLVSFNRFKNIQFSQTHSRFKHAIYSGKFIFIGESASNFFDVWSFS